MSSSYEYVLDEADLDGLSATILIDVEPDVSDNEKDADTSGHLHSSQTSNGHHHHHHHYLSSHTTPSHHHHHQQQQHYYAMGRGGAHAATAATRSEAGSSRRSSRKSGTSSARARRQQRRLLRQLAETCYPHSAELVYPLHLGSTKSGAVSNNNNTNNRANSSRGVARQPPVFTSTYVVDGYTQACGEGVEHMTGPRRSTRCANLRSTRHPTSTSNTRGGGGGAMRMMGTRLRTRAVDARRVPRYAYNTYNNNNNSNEECDGSSDEDDEATETVMYTVQDVCSDSDDAKDGEDHTATQETASTSASQPPMPARGTASAVTAAAAALYNKRLRKKLQRRQRQRNAEAELGVSAAVEALASRPAARTTHNGLTPFAASSSNGGADQAMQSAAQNVSQYFISPIHQSVAEASTPWAAHDRRYAFLGQGGLSQQPQYSTPLQQPQPQPTYTMSERKDGQSAAHSLAQLVRSNGCSNNGDDDRRGTRNVGSAHRLGGKRRSEGSYYYCVGYCSSSEEDGEEEEERNSSSSSSSGSDNSACVDDDEGKMRSNRKGKARTMSDVQMPAVFVEVVRPRKRRRLARRRMTEECGGSLVLRPLPCPSITPPGTSLPSSRADVREDLLANSLMNMTLQEDDFRLY